MSPKMSPENNGGEPTLDVNERRTSRRFPLKLAIRYRSAQKETLKEENGTLKSKGRMFARKAYTVLLVD